MSQHNSRRVFDDLEEQEPVSRSKTRNRRRLLADVVRMPGYQIMKEIAAEFVGSHASPIPRKIQDVVGYYTWSVIGDLVNQIFLHIDHEAKLARAEDERDDG